VADIDITPLASAVARLRERLARHLRDATDEQLPVARFPPDTFAAAIPEFLIEAKYLRDQLRTRLPSAGRLISRRLN
jgi:hypothetical protein